MSEYRLLSEVFDFEIRWLYGIVSAFVFIYSLTG